jgi:hypothetical protein
VREVLEHTILDDRHAAAGRALIVGADTNPGFAVETRDRPDPALANL